MPHRIKKAKLYKSIYILLLVFLFDLTHEVVTQISLITTSGDDINKSASIVTVVFFGVFGFIYAVVGLLYLFRLICFKECCQDSGIKDCGRFVNDIALYIGGLFYYFGDNFSSLMEVHGRNVGASESGIEFARSSQPIFLIVAIALHRAIPLCAEKCIADSEGKKSEDQESATTDSEGTKSEDQKSATTDSEGTKSEDQKSATVDKSEDKPKFAIFDLLTLLVEFDAWFTIAERAAEKSADSESCPITVVVVFIWLLYGFFLVVYVIIIVVTFISQDFELDFNVDLCLWIVSAFFMIACLALFLVGDNEIPLECTKGRNQGTEVARLVLLLASCLSFVVSFTCGIIHAIKVSGTTSDSEGTKSGDQKSATIYLNPMTL